MLIKHWLVKQLQRKTSQRRTSQMQTWQEKPWKKISCAAAVGISVGIAAAALSVHHPSLEMAKAATIAPYIVPVNATSPAFSAAREQSDEVNVQVSDRPAGGQQTGGQQTGGQVERLQTRNRRLEALVTVLRQRAADRQ